ncbi:MAG: hypothetical protein ACSLFF_06840 [Solirubrobacterales bacterium]
MGWRRSPSSHRPEVHDPRIDQIVEPNPGRSMHHVLITDASDLDAAVDGWLCEAFELSH